MSEATEVGQAALGAAVALFDEIGRVLLVRHTYGRFNWELPGGASEVGEPPDETARRELREETGVDAVLDRLTGVYFERSPDVGPMLHLVFTFRWDASLVPVPSSPEISELGFFFLDSLPKPISDFTEQRIRDAISDRPARVVEVARRRWRE